MKKLLCIVCTAFVALLSLSSCSKTTGISGFYKSQQGGLPCGVCGEHEFYVWHFDSSNNATWYSTVNTHKTECSTNPIPGCSGYYYNWSREYSYTIIDDCVFIGSTHYVFQISGDKLVDLGDFGSSLSKIK